MAIPGNQHCAKCIGTLSFPMRCVRQNSTNLPDDTSLTDDARTLTVSSTTASQHGGPSRGSVCILTVSSATARHSGLYTCSAVNVARRASRHCLVSVHGSFVRRADQ